MNDNIIHLCHYNDFELNTRQRTGELCPFWIWFKTGEKRASCYIQLATLFGWSPGCLGCSGLAPAQAGQTDYWSSTGLWPCDRTALSQDRVQSQAVSDRLASQCLTLALATAAVLNRSFCVSASIRGPTGTLIKLVKLVIDLTVVLLTLTTTWNVFPASDVTIKLALSVAEVSVWLYSPVQVLLTTPGQITMKCDMDIHYQQWMNSNSFVNPLTLPLVALTVQNVSLAISFIY